LQLSKPKKNLKTFELSLKTKVTIVMVHLKLAREFKEWRVCLVRLFLSVLTKTEMKKKL